MKLIVVYFLDFLAHYFEIAHLLQEINFQHPQLRWKSPEVQSSFFFIFFFLWYFFCWNEKRKNEKNVKKVLKPEGVAAPHNTAYAVRWHFFCFHFYIWIFYPTEIETFYELIIIVAVIEKKKMISPITFYSSKMKKKMKNSFMCNFSKISL